MSQASMGQASLGSEVAAPAIDDWSYHHVTFSKPATAELAGRLEQDPRYRQQIRRQSVSVTQAERPEAVVPELQVRKHGAGKNQGLWSEDLGTGATMGALNYPAKFSLTTTTANCASDFVVYPTGLVGSGTQASIVAYSNLYSGCTGTVPSVYWAYYIDSGNAIQNSPVFSLDGSQLAFVQVNSNEAALVLLKWVASASETVAHPDPVTLHGSYTNCHEPCRAVFNLNDAGTFVNDTNSSIFVDYPSDTAFVGDDSGYLHKFNPVFNGTPVNPPAEVKGGGWPVQLNPTTPTALASPVYDSVSGNVFVTDEGGFLYRVNSSTAAVTTSGQLDFSDLFDGGPGIVEGPILDFTSELLYVFATSDGSLSCNAGADCTAVYQLSTSFLAGDTGSEVLVGNSSIAPTPPSPMYIGAFDSTYKNSADATGHLYVCGNTGAAPTIYQVAIQGGVLGTVNPGPVLSSGTTPCSSVTDVLNPSTSGSATEWIFASAENGGVSSACAAAGCVFNFKDTPWLPANVYAVGQEILDSNFHVEFVSTPGTSGGTAPFWNIATGGSTTDNTVHWLDLGASSAATLPAWVKTHHYPKGSEILDPSGNIELVPGGTTDISGGTIPTFNPVVGGTTADGSVTWTNVGKPATAALLETGGTSGIIVDNTVATGTQAGASQVYFSILGSQACGTSGTGGCAVQASQSALK